MKLNLEKIPVLGSKFWRELGGKIPFWVKDDALKGIMQDNTSGYSYKSLQYVKYKANEMRKFGRGKEKKGAGERLSGYKAVSIESTQVNPVNMTLTGQTINNLRPIGSDDTSVTLSFSLADAGKVLGNQARGYDIVGLNDKNRELAKSLIIAELKKRQIEFIPKNIVIMVGK